MYIIVYIMIQYCVYYVYIYIYIYICVYYTYIYIYSLCLLCNYLYIAIVQNACVWQDLRGTATDQ